MSLTRFWEPERCQSVSSKRDAAKLSVLPGIRTSALNRACTSARFSRPAPFSALPALPRDDSATIGPRALGSRVRALDDDASRCITRERRGKESSRISTYRDREMRGRQGRRLAGTTASSIRTVGAFRKFTTTCVMPLSDVSSPPLDSLVLSTWRRKFSAVIRHMVGDSDPRDAWCVIKNKCRLVNV